MLAPPMALIGCFLLFLVRVSSVESVMGVAAAGGTFSMLLTGTLYLQVGQHQRVALHQNTPHSTARRLQGTNATPLTETLCDGRTHYSKNPT